MAPAQAGTAAPVEEVDVREVRNQLRVFQDDTQKILVMVPFGDNDWVFWGEPNGVLYQQPSLFSSANGTESYEYGLIDRRYNSTYRGISAQYRDGKTFVTCGETRLELNPLSIADGEARLKGAQFAAPFWSRNAHFLARDDYGVYYYIDKANTHDDQQVPESSYRVYIGWKGEILQAPLSMVAQDSVGEVYGMPNGDRRIVINRQVGRYFDGDDVRELHTLNLHIDSILMYRDGGVYDKARHGTPCDRFFPQ
jgi:hypothetical protein